MNARWIDAPAPAKRREVRYFVHPDHGATPGQPIRFEWRSKLGIWYHSRYEGTPEEMEARGWYPVKTDRQVRDEGFEALRNAKRQEKIDRLKAFVYDIAAETDTTMIETYVQVFDALARRLREKK